MITKSVKSFKEIPGPKSYPIVGTLLSYLPVVGKYRFDELHINGWKKFREFGPIVREEIIPGINVVWIFNPEDIQELFKNEGKHPQRRSHLAINYYRMSRPDLYNTGGLLPTNGLEWHRLRHNFQKGLSSPQNVKSYLPMVNEVVDDFTTYIKKCEKPLGDFLPMLSRVFLELLGLVAFDCRLNSFSEEELKPNSKSSRLMASILNINSSILRTDNGLQLWRFWETPLYKRLKCAHEFMESVGVGLVKKKQKELNNVKHDKKELSLLELYLSMPSLDFKDVIGMSSDMLLGGIDTTTYSTAFALYHLAKNQEKQELLFEESLKLLPEASSRVTADHLARAEYLKSSLKESLRMNPVSIGVGRILPEDAIFSGYRVEKGSTVVTQNQVICRMEKFFPEPSSFKPERWLKTDKNYQYINPYLVLPFGHGPRSCIARRLAEQNMQVLVLKLIRNFKFGWTGDSILETKTYLINKPDGPLKFSWATRE